jgi:hypothetical protein
MKNSLNFISKAVLGFMVGASVTLTGCDKLMESELSLEGSDITGQSTKITAPTSGVLPNRYIVVFKNEVKEELDRMTVAAVSARSEGEEHIDMFNYTKSRVDEYIMSLAKEAGVEEKVISNKYGHALCGFSAELSEEQVKVLSKNPNVAYIEADFEVKLELPLERKEATADITPMNVAQTTPWGITRVGGSVNVSGGRWAWVIDSGIDLDHPDLTVNTQFSRTFVSGTSSADDQNGHGTHVAGTIAAKNNTIGVVGVAAGATVVAVRVFGATGGSTNATIIAGIDYATANAMAGDVANMSLGGPASTATDDAVKRLAAKGVRCAVAAGNESQNALNVSPARANAANIWTVSAFDINNRFASFSNYSNPGSTTNTPIEVSAPGVNVNSCWLNGGYRSISGTSMATPHVAGILLLNNGVVRTSGTVTGDRATPADPRAIR